MTRMLTRPRRAIGLLSCALTLVAASIPAEAAGLGRLFFTPERRISLERQRSLGLQESPMAEDQTLNLHGVVRRSSGKSTTWINGVVQHESSSGMRIDLAPRDASRATVKLQGETPIPLRVGESVNRATREGKDGLAGGRIVIQRTAP